MVQPLTYPHLILYSYRLRDRASVASSSQVIPFDDNGWEQTIELGDSMGILAALSSHETDPPQPIDCLYEYKTKLDDRLKNFQTKNEKGETIGTTWLILACISSESKAVRQAVAIEAYQTTFQTEAVPKIKPHEFLGGSLFEIEEIYQTSDRVLVCLWRDRDRMEEMQKYYYDWLLIFYHRHKVVWSYQNSRQIKKRLVAENFFPDADTIPKISISLDDFKLDEADFHQLRSALYENMRILTQHTTGLESLAMQSQTLKLNLENYCQSVKRLQVKAEASLPFLTDFYDKIAPQYRNQIEEDRISLSPGLKVREQLIDTVRSLVEVSQAQRDRDNQRHIERHITIVGAGVGAASAAASASAGLVTEIARVSPIKVLQKDSEVAPVFNLAIVLLFSAVVGVFVAWLTSKFWPRDR